MHLFAHLAGNLLFTRCGVPFGPCNPASLFLASSTSGIPGSASFQRQRKTACGIDIKCNQSTTPCVNQLEMNYSNLMRHVFFAAFSLLFCLAVSSLAQPRSQSFSLTLSGGFLSNTTFGRLNPLPNTADVPEVIVSLKNKGTSFGLTLGYLITNRIELQGIFTYSRSEIINEVGIGLAGIPLGKTKVSDTKTFYYSGNILFYIPLNWTSPYVTVGLGAASLKPAKLRSRTKVFLNFGAGIRFILSRHFSTFLEIKDYVTFFNYPKDFEVFFPAIYSPDFKKSQHRLGIHASLSYNF
jgi:opacity protein-like surface antigen